MDEWDDFQLDFFLCFWTFAFVGPFTESSAKNKELEPDRPSFIIHVNFSTASFNCSKVNSSMEMKETMVYFIPFISETTSFDTQL